MLSVRTVLVLNTREVTIQVNRSFLREQIEKRFNLLDCLAAFLN